MYFRLYILHVRACIFSSIVDFRASSCVCQAYSEHNKLKLLLKRRLPVISLKNAAHVKGI